MRYNLNSDIELYDLNEDEGETNNQAHLYPEIVKKSKDVFENSSSEQYGFPYGGVVQNYKSMERFVQ